MGLLAHQCHLLGLDNFAALMNDLAAQIVTLISDIYYIQAVKRPSLKRPVFQVFGVMI